jgi:hypothetical protein
MRVEIEITLTASAGLMFIAHVRANEMKNNCSLKLAISA